MKEEISNNITKLLPPELEVAKEFIDKLLITKSPPRVTNIEYLERKRM